MDGFPGGVAFYIVTRQPQSAFRFQKLPEVCAPFGLDRSPPSQFVVRLRNFPPNLLDLLIVAQTTSADISLFSRSREPLASDKEREKITNVFVTTTMANDSLRAALPLSAGGESSDTSPIGVAVDLSARERVFEPIPGEEIDESPHPLPNYMVLNNEGVLSSWWVMYTDSIRQGVAYPSLAVNGGIDQKLPGAEPTPSTADFPMQTSAPSSGTIAAPSFSQSAFGQSSAPTNPLAAPKLNLSPAPGMASTPSFGSSSFGQPAKSPWSSGGFGGTSAAPSTAPSFGQPSFGSSTPLGANTGGAPAAFGASGGLGAKVSPWASAGAAGGASFGQPGGAGLGSGVPTFGASTGDTPSTGGGFGNYAKGGGFGGLAGGQPTSGSSFGSPGGDASAKPASALFGKPADNLFVTKPADSPFGKPANTSFGSSMDTSFGLSPGKPATGSGLFGAGNEGFKLSSTFKPDGSAATDGLKPSPLGSGGFNFGGLGDALGQPAKPSGTPDIKEESMDEGHDEPPLPPAPPSLAPNSFTSVSTPPPSSQPKTPLFPTTTTPLFGTTTKPGVTPAAVQESKPGPTFVPPKSTTPQDTPQKVGLTPPTLAPPSPKIKTEPLSDDDATPAATPMRQKDDLDEPLPPASTSKTEYTAGDISGTSSEISRGLDDAPLPPDFVTAKKSEEDSQPPLPNESDEEEGTEDFEESGDDITKDDSPIDEPTQSIKFSPESSFGTTDRSPLGGSFTKVSQPNEALREVLKPKPKPLFGEVGSNSIPIFHPPTKQPESPRSPSPIRPAILPNMLRPESSRSVSAPTRGESVIQNRIQKLGRSPLARDPTPEEKRAEELEKLRVAQEQSRREAEQDNLTDDEDERLRQELSADIEATRDLDDFVYHQDYARDATKPGIPGQIELLYRDINSMIDNLGINARTLESWMKWQMENYTEVDEVDTNRLNIDEDDWCLQQVEEIPIIADTISKELEVGRLHDIGPKVRECHDLAQSCAKLDAKTTTIRKTIDARKDPALLSAPLSAEQASIQHDLRKSSKTVQTLLVEVEQSISVLRAQLSSVNTTNESATDRKRPTVEAVTTTIQKMTGMAEKRSVDIDLLESQLRKLDLVADGELSLIRISASPSSSREASPFQTPPPQGQINGKRRSIRKAPSSSINSPGNTSLYYTPDSTPGKTRPLKSSLRTSTNGSGFRASADREGTPSRRLQRVSVSEEPRPGEKARYREKMRRRKEVLEVVKDALTMMPRGVRQSVEGRAG
jgi:nucleoporin NUP159